MVGQLRGENCWAAERQCAISQPSLVTVADELVMGGEDRCASTAPGDGGHAVCARGPWCGRGGYGVVKVREFGQYRGCAQFRKRGDEGASGAPVSC